MIQMDLLQIKCQHAQTATETVYKYLKHVKNV